MTFVFAAAAIVMAVTCALTAGSAELYKSIVSGALACAFAILALNPGRRQ